MKAEVQRRRKLHLPLILALALILGDMGRSDDHQLFTDRPTVAPGSDAETIKQLKGELKDPPWKFEDCRVKVNVDEIRQEDPPVFQIATTKTKSTKRIVCRLSHPGTDLYVMETSLKPLRVEKGIKFWRGQAQGYDEFRGEAAKITVPMLYKEYPDGRVEVDIGSPKHPELAGTRPETSDAYTVFRIDNRGNYANTKIILSHGNKNDHALWTWNSCGNAFGEPVSAFLRYLDQPPAAPLLMKREAIPTLYRARTEEDDLKFEEEEREFRAAYTQHTRDTAEHLQILLQYPTRESFRKSGIYKRRIEFLKEMGWL